MINGYKFQEVLYQDELLFGNPVFPQKTIAFISICNNLYAKLVKFCDEQLNHCVESV